MEDGEDHGGAQGVGAGGRRPQEARLRPEVVGHDGGPALPGPAGQPLAPDERPAAGDRLHRRHGCARRRPGAGVHERAAETLRLPERGGVPVELGAQRRQQQLEGRLGVRRLRQRRGDPQRRGQVAAHLQLALEPDGGAGVAEHTDDHAPGGRIRRAGDPRQGQLDGDLRPVRVLRRELCGRPEERARARRAESREAGGVRRPESLRHQHRQGLSAQGLRVVAEQGAHRTVRVDDAALVVGDDHDVGQGLEQGGGGESRDGHWALTPSRRRMRRPRVAYGTSGTEHALSTCRQIDRSSGAGARLRR